MPLPASAWLRSRSRLRSPPVGILLADGHSQQRVVAQRFVVVEVLVAADDPQYPLRQHILDSVLDARRVAVVCEAGRELPQQARTQGSLTQQRDASADVTRPASNAPSTRRRPPG